MAKQFFDSGIVQEAMVWRHTSRGRTNHMEWYPPGTVELTKRPFRGRGVDQFLEKIDVCLFYETPFDWSFLRYCQDRKVKTALIPMYEWSPVKWTYKPDLLICPSLLDKDYFPEGIFLNVPVDPSHWKLRTHANRFLHNAGNIGCKEHKGTRQLLEAVQHVRHPDFRLTVRAQDTSGLRSIVNDNPHVARDSRVTIEYGEIPYEKLWDDHDVLVAPEKLNGLSLPLQEGWAAGMCVITTDRYPANTWLPRDPLIPVERYEKARQSAGCFEFDLAVVDPRIIAAVLDHWVGKDISQISQDGKAWAEAHSWANMKPKYEKVFEELCR